MNKMSEFLNAGITYDEDDVKKISNIIGDKVNTILTKLEEISIDLRELSDRCQEENQDGFAIDFEDYYTEITNIKTNLKTLVAPISGDISESDVNGVVI